MRGRTSCSTPTTARATCRSRRASAPMAARCCWRTELRALRADGGEPRYSPFHILLLRREHLAGLDVQRLGLVLDLAQRRRRRARAQQGEAAIDAFGLLQREAVAVARADEILDDRGAVGV